MAELLQLAQTQPVAARERKEEINVRRKESPFGTANIDVVAVAATPLFDKGKVRSLIPIRLTIIVVRDRIEARGLSFAFFAEGIRHAHDGSGIHPAT